MRDPVKMAARLEVLERVYKFVEANFFLDYQCDYRKCAGCDLELSCEVSELGKSLAECGEG